MSELKESKKIKIEEKIELKEIEMQARSVVKIVKTSLVDMIAV